MPKTLKIAFRVWGENGWQGSILSYHEGFFHALRETYGNEVRLCIVAEDECRVPKSLIRHADRIVVLPKFRSRTEARLIDRAINKFFFHNSIMIEHLLKRQGIDAMFDLEALWSFGKIPTLSCVLDFRHIHLPDSYDNQQRDGLENTYRRASEIASRVILISETVRKDFLSFFPQHANKSRVLQPVSCIPSSAYEEDLKSVVQRYHLPEKFIYLPNQFWKHKNHELVFRALQLLKSRGVKIFVVCSGFPINFHCEVPFFSNLLGNVSRWGVRDQVVFLGFIPRSDVFLLMRQSVCVLNPSLFEGFGLSVGEARSLGKRVLASDIPAHREQDPPSAIFFNPYDCQDLAAKLEEIWCAQKPGPDEKLESEARASLPKRVRHYAESFMKIIKEVVP